MLDFDFFELLDSVTIARSRKHIEKYYDTSAIGEFPTRLPVLSVRPPLSLDKNIVNYNQIYDYICQLNLKIYMPSDYIFASKMDKYSDENAKLGTKLSREGMLGREQGIRRLMSINLLKRLESSVYSFKLTLERIKFLICSTIDNIEKFEQNGTNIIEAYEITDYSDEFDYDDQNTDILSVGQKQKIDLADMDCTSWKADLVSDKNVLQELLFEIDKITPVQDAKLQKLYDLIINKLQAPINRGNNKIIIFTAFADTAEYLYKNVSKFVKDNFKLETALVTGKKNTTTLGKFGSDLNTVLTFFSPISKKKSAIYPNDNRNIDILIATDCISEGQNLQDCDYLVNYDIHWNPVRIIQRFGRIDRIGSKNEYIQLVNFWADVTLDEYINLKSRVESRMKITIMTSTGTSSDNVLDEEEKKDLEYRKKQLERLQNEVVDLEEMNTGVNIMDLGLNEFRLDLLNYLKTNPDIEESPHGLHAVIKANNIMPAGVVYILKNISSKQKNDKQNRLHPFYMVYISETGEVICNHLEPKKMLDMLRAVCKQNPNPDIELCKLFNQETKDGRDMSKYSQLLESAISTIIDVKDESDFDSFFSEGESSYLKNIVSGLNDFELICFLVVR